MNKSTKEISVFVDESGSFDPDRNSSRYYSICMVFHDQSVDFSEELARAKLSEPEGLSESEHVFFGGEKKFKKNYLKLLDRKIFS